MPPESDDSARLWDMLRAARLATEFIRDVSKTAYLNDLRTQSAVERQIEIVGEAARKVSDDFKTLHPHIPWRAIMAQRHVLAHEYGQIDQEAIWRVLTIHLPELIRLLEPLVNPSKT